MIITKTITTTATNNNNNDNNNNNNNNGKHNVNMSKLIRSSYKYCFPHRSVCEKNAF